MRRGRVVYALAVLFLVNFMNFYDRQVLGAVGEVIKREWQLTDAQLAGLTTAFVLLYAVVGIPLGRLADVGRRKAVLSAGILVWSLFTGLSGLAPSFGLLVACRLGVGVGEASAAPVGNSLIGDLFPPERRARALSVFMLGLPLGLGASYVVSGAIAEAVGGWRPALLVAAVPGVLLGVAVLWLPEPTRGASDRGGAGGPPPAGTWSAIQSVLRLASMRWIIASGALFNLNMYALGAFNTSFLIRFHGLDIGMANRVSGAIYGIGGGLGLVLGGVVGDRVARFGAGGRLKASAVALLLTAPLVAAALAQAPGSWWGFGALMLAGAAVMYVYYATVYAAIADLVPATRRGTAMAVYFFAFYVFTAVGLVLFGRLSDALAARALRLGTSAEVARAAGLHGALYAVPVTCVVLVGVLWAAARAASRDVERAVAAPGR